MVVNTLMTFYEKCVKNTENRKESLLLQGENSFSMSVVLNDFNPHELRKFLQH